MSSYQSDNIVVRWLGQHSVALQQKTQIPCPFAGNLVFVNDYCIEEPSSADYQI